MYLINKTLWIYKRGAVPQRDGGKMTTRGQLTCFVPQNYVVQTCKL